MRTRKEIWEGDVIGNNKTLYGVWELGERITIELLLDIRELLAASGVQNDFDERQGRAG